GLQRRAAFFIERIEPSQDVHGLADHQPHFSPVEGDLLERQQWPAIGNMSFNARLVYSVRRDGHAGLHAALQLHERELHLDGRSQLRVGLFQLLEFEDFTGFGTGWARRAVLMRLMHRAIFVQITAG
ncbi:MAG: hypothetical protein ACRD1Q_01175, partial [Vicinamibacterales bacterium]